MFQWLFPLVMLVAATALSFVNAWPDEVVLDDKFFVNNQHLPDWTEPAELFRGDVWRTVGSQSGLYRPALLLSLSLDTRLFGGWLPGYHLSNILLHLLVTLLVYGFLRHLLQAAPQRTARPDLYALLAALVFAVHPVHTEVVNSVFNRSDMLVSLGAVAGLWWLLHFLETHPARAWAGLAVGYLFALFSKENAVVIPGLAVILILLLSTASWGQRIRRSIPVLWMLLPLGLYLYMRAHALAPTAAET
ncbi:MAG: glycosyltransferase family 39 protein, partial [Xanthomonadales bacterium]|nr:glycosyltransferase family 39 protein [Xanthomonadales bacterium]